MSKKSKAKARLERLKKKRGVRATNQRAYEGYIADGKNSKSKRNRRAGAKRIVKDNKHAIDHCGNLGCKSCYPMINDPKLAKPGTALYSKQFTRRVA